MKNALTLSDWIGSVILVVILAAVAVWFGLNVWIAIPVAVVAVFINALLIGHDV